MEQCRLGLCLIYVTHTDTCTQTDNKLYMDVLHGSITLDSHVYCGKNVLLFCMEFADKNVLKQNLYSNSHLFYYKFQLLGNTIN